MSKTLKTIFAGLAALSLLSGSALAEDRYVQRPSVQISPDLSAPWVLQLRSHPGRVKVSGIRTGVPGVTVLGAPAPRQKVRIVSRQQDFGIIQLEPQSRTLPDPIVQQAGLTTPKRITQRQAREIDPMFLPQQVDYVGNEKPGTIVISTRDKFLYLVEGNGQARRYGVGVGKEGFVWKGSQKISRKAEWPSWTPPTEMKVRVRLEEGRILPDRMEGGPDNPLGARAMYLGSTLYRIHGTNQPWTIGKNVSSGCIRMRNEDVTDLYERVGIGTQVIVR
jgi:lipoprotein-anchoring transpeptidase ErfK/SrfK